MALRPAHTAESPIPLVDLHAQYRSIRSEVDEAVARILGSAKFILGDEVELFEAEFARYVDASGAVGVASGTAAIHLALLACGVGPGDEVITASHTFIATAEAICYTGARPVFADIDPLTYTIDPNHVESLITDRTRAVLAVHLYGHPAAMNELASICARHEIPLVEDAAQAHGAQYDGRMCGSIGRLACFSFYPGKNLGAAGDAGAVTGNDEHLLARVRQLRDHGRTDKYIHAEIGYAERIDALQAAILRAKLPHLDSWIEARRSHAARYSELLSDGELGLPVEAEGARHGYHLYVVRSDRRDALLAQLKERQIGAGIHYPVPVHLQPAFAGAGNEQTPSLPHTELAAREVLSLPLYPELSDDQITAVVAAISDASEA